MSTELTISVPDDLMDRLREVAGEECRTPEQQALWLIVVRCGKKEPQLSPEDRLAKAAPVLAALQELHLAAGKPLTREITARALNRDPGARVSHTTVHDLLTAKRFPRWGALESIVTALGGDTKEFRRLWVAAAAGQPGP